VIDGAGNVAAVGSTAAGDGAGRADLRHRSGQQRMMAPFGVRTRLTALTTNGSSALCLFVVNAVRRVLHHANRCHKGFATCLTSGRTAMLRQG